MKRYTMGLDYEQEVLIEKMKSNYEEAIGKKIPTSKYLRKLLFSYIERDEKLAKVRNSVMENIANYKEVKCY